MLESRIWHDMFVVSIPILEKIIRPVLVYVFLVVGLRLAGKRELAQLNTFDLVVLLTLSNTVQNAIIGDDNSLSGGLIGATTLLGINHFVNRLIYSSPKLDQILEGDQTVLIRDGIVDEGACHKEFVTRSELEAAAHRQGFTSLEEIAKAVLEPGGTITIVGRKPTPAEEQHAEVVKRLDAILAGVSQLKT
jgi:uncharacterized membrane protein YcaP (DUF421 family)